MIRIYRVRRESYDFFFAFKNKWIFWSLVEVKGRLTNYVLEKRERNLFFTKGKCRFWLPVHTVQHYTDFKEYKDYDDFLTQHAEEFL